MFDYSLDYAVGKLDFIQDNALPPDHPESTKRYNASCFDEQLSNGKLL